MTKGMLKTQISVFFLSLFFSDFDFWVQSVPFCTNFIKIIDYFSTPCVWLVFAGGGVGGVVVPPQVGPHHAVVGGCAPPCVVYYPGWGITDLYSLHKFLVMYSFKSFVGHDYISAHSCVPNQYIL